jgi:uncharacterized NAD(P)/FAD-binding protein YdhS
LLVARLKPPNGKTVEREFDSIIVCSGASRDIRDNPLLGNLVDQGLAQADDVDLGLSVDALSRLIDARRATQSDLFAFGPITRGTFGEMTGVPDIMRQIERVVGVVTAARAPIPSDGLQALASYN